jgi:hypothetical protein
VNEIALKMETPEAAEMKALARELAAAYAERVRRYQHELGLSAAEAVAKADAPAPVPRLWEIEDRPPEQVTWEDLEELARASPARAVRRYEEVKRAAREAVRGGEFAAAALAGRESQPWHRALALALRAELADGLGPRTGIEQQLLDQMALAQAQLYLWQGRLADAAAVPGDRAADQAGEMLERFSRVFLRTLRALQEQRRHAPAVVVQNVGGQVNVGAQQLNVAPQADTRNGHAQPLREERRQSPRPCTCAVDRGFLIGGSG